MKKLLLILSVLAVLETSAQVGIGTTTPHSSAALDLASTNKGFLPPRVALTSTTDNSTIANAANGLLIYNTATSGSGATAVTPGYYYRNGSSWLALAVRTASNTFSLAATEVVRSGSSQAVPSGSFIDVTNSTITVTVPSGYTNRQVILRWDIWGDVTAPAAGIGSLRFQVDQTGTSSATFQSVMMSSWSLAATNFAYRWNAPVSYVIDNLAPGTYTFKLQVQREGETVTPSPLNIWGLSGLAQVYVK